MEVVGEIRHDRQHQIGVGEGMNSEVFKCHDPQLGGDFAIKIIEKTRFGGDITKYFEEAQAMFATAHPNIVPIQYACQDASHVMLAMPFYAHGSLGARISSGPITTKELIRIAVGILHGVGQIHTAGYVHFDLKPSNVLFNDVDDPLVSDFGQTRKVLPSGAIVVPSMYQNAIPPETLSTGAGGPLGDIYQLGLLFYRAINGDDLYRGQFSGLDWPTRRQLIMVGRLPDRKLFLPHVPKRMRTIIRKALKCDPSLRYQSAEQFSKAIAATPIGLNWETRIDPSGEMVWHTERPGRADLEVRLLKTSGTWSVRAWTVNGASKRAMGSSSLNRFGLDLPSAMGHLKEVFAQLA